MVLCLKILYWKHLEKSLGKSDLEETMRGRASSPVK